MSVVSTTEDQLLRTLVDQGVVVGKRTPFLAKTWRFFHRVAFSSSIAAGTKLTFFNNFGSNFTDMITNFPANGQLPQGEFFTVQGIWVRAVSGINVDGSVAGSNGSGSFSGNATDQTSLKPDGLHENARLLGENGVVQFNYDNITWVKFAGLNAFPGGRGIDGYSSSGDPAAGGIFRTNSNAQAGVPALANIFTMNPFVIRSGDAIDFSVTFPTALTLQVAGFIEAGLVGTYHQRT